MLRRYAASSNGPPSLPWRKNQRSRARWRLCPSGTFLLYAATDTLLVVGVRPRGRDRSLRSPSILVPVPAFGVMVWPVVRVPGVGRLPVVDRQDRLRLQAGVSDVATPSRPRPHPAGPDPTALPRRLLGYETRRWSPATSASRRTASSWRGPWLARARRVEDDRRAATRAHRASTRKGREVVVSHDPTFDRARPAGADTSSRARRLGRVETRPGPWAGLCGGSGDPRARRLLGPVADPGLGSRRPAPDAASGTLRPSHHDRPRPQSPGRHGPRHALPTEAGSRHSRRGHGRSGVVGERAGYRPPSGSGTSSGRPPGGDGRPDRPPRRGVRAGTGIV